MLDNAEPMQQEIVKTSRHRAIVRAKHQTLEADASALKERASVWAEAHPWSVIGVVLGAAGVLGYNLGIRS